MKLYTKNTPKYKHYKGGEYVLLGIALHTETMEEMVVYCSLSESSEFGTNAMWVRPKSMFFEEVEVDGNIMPRFSLISK